METKRLTDAELNEIKALRDNFNGAYGNLGMIVNRINELEKDKEETLQFIQQLKESETKIYESLKTNYGDGVIDLTTGEFKSQN